MGGKLSNHDLGVLRDARGLNNEFGSLCKSVEELTLRLLSEELIISNEV